MTIMSCALPLGTLFEISSLGDVISQYLDSQTMFGKQREDPRTLCLRLKAMDFMLLAFPSFLPVCLNLRELSD